MTGKSDYELLMSDPAAMKRFQDELERAATVIALNKEIEKISDRTRMMLRAAQATGMDPSNILEQCRAHRHQRLDVFAVAVGTERGKRIGKDCATRMIENAHKYARLQLSKSAWWLEGVKLLDDD